MSGTRLPAKTYRILFGGGGAGDTTVMLAAAHAAGGIDAEIIHLDISRASSAIANTWIDARSRTNTSFVHGAIETIAKHNLGIFDYIDCCGVLHHLKDPVAGLRTVRDTLRPTGGIGMIVYAPLGQTGVYHAQPMLQLIAGEAPDSERIATARQLLEVLPDTNWLKRNPYVADHVDQGDAGIYDLLLHHHDRAYSVQELTAMIQRGGVRPLNFVDQACYGPGF